MPSLAPLLSFDAIALQTKQNGRAHALPNLGVHESKETQPPSQDATLPLSAAGLRS
ncbi:conserved protein of unknown function [Pseudomonas marincola]|uniref:Uncharacterized protein n=1 Tax=Pseudomonas marincola TaxID=437900 RepID=A0A653E3N9_9PSED|nr:conserved protein of unknown function [Pseudomonas marincola]